MSMKISVALAQVTQRQFTDDLSGYTECNNAFQGSDEGVSPIKHCPRCVEAMQERMLNAIFGEVKRS